MKVYNLYLKDVSIADLVPGHSYFSTQLKPISLEISTQLGYVVEDVVQYPAIFYDGFAYYIFSQEGTQVHKAVTRARMHKFIGDVPASEIHKTLESWSPLFVNDLFVSLNKPSLNTNFNFIEPATEVTYNKQSSQSIEKILDGLKTYNPKKPPVKQFAWTISKDGVNLSPSKEDIPF